MADDVNEYADHGRTRNSRAVTGSAVADAEAKAAAAHVLPESETDAPLAVPPAEQREVLSWQTFGDATREIAQEIWDSGWMPDLIVAIARGGLLPAGAISYALGVKSIGAMNVEFYTDIAQTLDAPMLIPPLMDTSVLEGKKVLVIDDVADSGKTLQLVMDMIRNMGIPQPDGGTPVTVAEARCATIYHKSRSIIVPDYVWKRTEKWINFPWSTLPPVSDPTAVGA
ncbi:MAG: phosphoribosyltransferase [Actinomycetaceae bacterium]|nr:phosphoribosyltransferase [Arcanobacterium sp.]MDD7686893.1 phosphoribosyltransferase [Actinomycetaceae bacterium]MDY5274016.1 phosphoribosyltransferase [Arcanobacterium sp.]